MAVILITGSSTGIGQEAAVQLSRSGHTVYASCRNPDSAAELRQRAEAENLSLQIVPLDLLDRPSVDACLATILDREGRLDVLVSNAGVGGGRALEETPIEEIREVYETNVFGAFSVMQAVIPIMRRQRSGRLVNVTSLAAVNVFGCHGTYSSSKAAVEAMCVALSQELSEFNIRVSMVEPGCILTPMWGKGTMPPEDSAYGNSFGRLMKFGEYGLGRAATTVDCANAIQDAIESDSPRFRYPVGPDAEDFWKAYTALNDDEEWRRIASLDNAAYAREMEKLMGVDYYGYGD
jgi:NAD(P)-dependent dehydrogenase (short-subunit alcohol dehydrogenase family)